MIVRPATLADIPAITAIYDEAVRTGTATFELDPPDEAEMARRFEAVTGGAYPYLVATAQGEGILGYAYGSAFRTRPAYRFTVEDSIYVAPFAQKRGVGRALLKALLNACESGGFRQMLAVIGDSGNSGSIALHRAAGFTPVGTLTASGLKFGRWIDTVIMQRPLGVGDATIPHGDPRA